MADKLRRKLNLSEDQKRDFERYAGAMQGQDLRGALSDAAIPLEETPIGRVDQPDLRQSIKEPKPEKKEKSLLDKGKERQSDKAVVESIVAETPSKDDASKQKKKFADPVTIMPELNKYEAELKKQKLFEDPAIQSRLEGIKDAADQARQQYQKDKNMNQWLSVAETLGQALVQLGAGAYGLKHGVDMSGLKFNKTDWSKNIDRAMDELENKQEKLAVERREVLGERGAERGRIAGVRAKLDKLAKAKRAEKLRLDSERFKQQQQKAAEEKPAEAPRRAPTVADKEFEKAVGKLRANPAQMAAAERNIDQIEEAISRIKAPGQLTGTLWQFLPKSVREVVDRESVDVQEIIEQVVQQDLRQTLGAQFTEREGTRLIERAYNPRLPERLNLQRLQRLASQMKEAAANQKAAIQYYDENGTLAGFDKKLYKTADDFDLGKDEEAPEQQQAPGGPKVGEVMDGYRFLGGDPSDQKNWEEVR